MVETDDSDAVAGVDSAAVAYVDSEPEATVRLDAVAATDSDEVAVIDLDAKAAVDSDAVFVADSDAVGAVASEAIVASGSEVALDLAAAVVALTAAVASDLGVVTSVDSDVEVVVDSCAEEALDPNVIVGVDSDTTRRDYPGVDPSPSIIVSHELATDTSYALEVHDVAAIGALLVTSSSCHLSRRPRLRAVRRPRVPQRGARPLSPRPAAGGRSAGRPAAVRAGRLGLETRRGGAPALGAAAAMEGCAGRAGDWRGPNRSSRLARQRCDPRL